MPIQSLREDTFRVLAYIRAYADNRHQHLDPQWIAEQLNLSQTQMEQAFRDLASLELAEISEWPNELLQRCRELNLPGITDICLTEQGWNLLWSLDQEGG